MKRVKPKGDRLTVRPFEESEMTSGGLYIPHAAKEKQSQGVVLAVGPGAWHDGRRIPMDVAVGDTVMFGKYAGTEIEVEGEKVLVLRESDVLLGVEDDEDEK